VSSVQSAAGYQRPERVALTQNSRRSGGNGSRAADRRRRPRIPGWLRPPDPQRTAPTTRARRDSQRSRRLAAVRLTSGRRCRRFDASEGRQRSSWCRGRAEGRRGACCITQDRPATEQRRTVAGAANEVRSPPARRAVAFPGGGGPGACDRAVSALRFVGRSTGTRAVGTRARTRKGHTASSRIPVPRRVCRSWACHFTARDHCVELCRGERSAHRIELGSPLVGCACRAPRRACRTTAQPVLDVTTAMVRRR
jgi:hypothetical protein